MTTGQNQDRAQPSALAGAKFAGTCPSGPWGNMCGYPRTQRQMLTIHLQFPGLWLLPSLASSPGPQIRRRRLTQVESNVHSGSISLARGCGTGHVARLAGLWLDRFLKKGSRWNNPVESSVPQILLRQVFYSVAGNGIAFGSLRRGKREEGVLVMLIFRTGFGLSGRRQRCAPAESLGALPGSLPPLPFSSLDRAALALSVSAGSGMPSASPSATPFPLPGTPWLPGKFLLIL